MSFEKECSTQIVTVTILGSPNLKRVVATILEYF